MRRLPRLVLAIILGSGIAEAAPAPAGRPPELTPETFDAWVAAKLDVKGWTFLSHDSVGATYCRRGTADAFPIYRLRREYVRPVQGPRGLTFRSVEIDVQLDCEHLRRRDGRGAIFADNNLRGDSQVPPELQEADWRQINPNGAFGAELYGLCRPEEPRLGR